MAGRMLMRMTDSLLGNSTMGAVIRDTSVCCFPSLGGLRKSCCDPVLVETLNWLTESTPVYAGAPADVLAGT
jgi:hypothetical protein